jgi:putative toxin-antitoxin system antitoxin component (TIGR02293 family)
MRKKKTILKNQSEIPPMQLSEPEAVYHRQLKAQPSLKDFSYSEFKKIADKTPFTQAEWASILHVSERTLQRYAKSNSYFAPINAERALQIANVLKRAKDVLGKIDNFYTWIKRKPQALEGELSFDSLTTADGINKILIQLGRIEHGLFA